MGRDPGGVERNRGYEEGKRDRGKVDGDKSICIQRD